MPWTHTWWYTGSWSPVLPCLLQTSQEFVHLWGFRFFPCWEPGMQGFCLALLPEAKEIYLHMLSWSCASTDSSNLFKYHSSQLLTFVEILRTNTGNFSDVQGNSETSSISSGMVLAIPLKVQDLATLLSFALDVHRLALIYLKIGRTIKNSKCYYYPESRIDAKHL